MSRPLGKVWLPSMRSSSKNGCAQAFSGVMRALGVYSSSCDTKLIASVGVRIRKTCGMARIKLECNHRQRQHHSAVFTWVGAESEQDTALKGDKAKNKYKYKYTDTHRDIYISIPEAAETWDRRRGTFNGKTTIKASQAKSNWIKSNQIKSNQFKFNQSTCKPFTNTFTNASAAYELKLKPYTISIYRFDVIHEIWICCIL